MRVVRLVAGALAGAVLLLGCTQTESARIETTVTATTTVTFTSEAEPPSEAADVGETSPAATPLVLPTTPWLEAEGESPWTTELFGLPGTAHVRIGYGPLGFISINAVAEGSVVRLSGDGATWTETAMLHGPGGEEQISIQDLAQTSNEYLAVGTAWSNIGSGSEIPFGVLWRSRDGVQWTANDLSAVAESFEAAAALPTPEGLMLAGTAYDDGVGEARPSLWIETSDGGWDDMTGGSAAFDAGGWITGATLDGEGLIMWGEDREGGAVVWQTRDRKTWTNTAMPGRFGNRVIDVTAFGGGYVAVGWSQTWTSSDAVAWSLASEAKVFTVDAVSEGTVMFRRVFVQDGYLLATASIGYRRGAAWCYLDAANCRKSVDTVLVSQDAMEWRRLPLPGELHNIDHPVEIDAVLVDDRLAVLHAVGDDAVLSTLTEVSNAQVLDTGEAPDLAFVVIEPGTEADIEIGVRYGYPLYTHCGLPVLGPLNGTYWGLGERLEFDRQEIAGWGLVVYGFVELTTENELAYVVNDTVIARYQPDAAAREPDGCI